MLATVTTERRMLRGENPGGSAAKLGLPAKHPEIQTYLAAPLASVGLVYGWICLVGNEGCAFTYEDEQLLMALAGQVGRVYALEHEIVERKHAESAARHQRDRAERYLDTAEVILLKLDLEGRIVLVNRYACSILGWTADELLGRDWNETCLPVRFRQVIRAKFYDVLAGDVSVIENPILTKAGDERLIEWHNRVLRDDAGQVAGVFASGTDITDRTQAVAALRATEAQYQQAQKMEAIGRLAGGVAHDFNNLLTAILGYSGVLLEDLDPGDPRRPDVAGIRKAAESGAVLTRQLLAFGRKEIVAPTVIDLNVVVTGMWAIFERLIGEGVKPVLVLPALPALVRADHGQVEQIVMNLGLNARDAMPAGGTLTVEVAHVDVDERFTKMHLAMTPGPYVILTVTDTGTGMTTATRARLFEPFFTTKEPGKGTGLGLATVHGIVAQSGGMITVDSAVGSGSAFRVYFPEINGGDQAISVPPATSIPAHV